MDRPKGHPVAPFQAGQGSAGQEVGLLRVALLVAVLTFLLAALSTGLFTRGGDEGPLNAGLEEVRGTLDLRLEGPAPADEAPTELP